MLFLSHKKIVGNTYQSKHLINVQYQEAIRMGFLDRWSKLYFIAYQLNTIRQADCYAEHVANLSLKEVTLMLK